MSSQVTLYTTHCPKCEVLKKKLEAANIQYETVDDRDEILKVAEKHNFTSVPLLSIPCENEYEIFDFGRAVSWINSQSKV